MSSYDDYAATRRRTNNRFPAPDRIAEREGFSYEVANPGIPQSGRADNNAAGTSIFEQWRRSQQGGGQGGDGGGGYNNYQDPGFAQMLANLRAAGALDASERQRLIQQSLIRFGLVPEGMKDPYGDATDLVRGLAGEKTKAGLSTYARMQDWNKQTLSRLKKALAARGALRSGELGFGLERQDLGYRQTFDDSLSQLLDYISGAQAAFARAEMGRSMQQADFMGGMPMPFGFGGGSGVAAPAPIAGTASVAPSVRGLVSSPTSAPVGSAFIGTRSSAPASTSYPSWNIPAY